MQLPQIHSPEELTALVEQVGFLPFFAHDIKGFSIEECCPPQLWFSDTVDGPWEWKRPVARTKCCVYGKLFNGKAGFVSRQWLSDDGKLWYTGGKAMEAPTLEDLKAEAWWTTRPGSTCYITVNENGKSTRINLDYSYDLEAEQYKVIILVHSVS